MVSGCGLVHVRRLPCLACARAANPEATERGLRAQACDVRRQRLQFSLRRTSGNPNLPPAVTPRAFQRCEVDAFFLRARQAELPFRTMASPLPDSSGASAAASSSVGDRALMLPAMRDVAKMHFLCSLPPTSACPSCVPSPTAALPCSSLSSCSSTIFSPPSLTNSRSVNSFHEPLICQAGSGEGEGEALGRRAQGGRGPLGFLRSLVVQAPPALPDIVQAGDPVLHEPAQEVPQEKIGSEEIQRVINDMVAVMRAAPGVGLSANQIGVPLRIIVLEDTEEYMRYSDAQEVKAQERTAFPLLVIINPVIKPIGNRRARFFEGCLSVQGFRGVVERHLDVEVSGLSRTGQPISFLASGWQARILQHECDHLGGLVYVDRLIPRTFRTQDNLRLPLPATCPPLGRC